ncbi:unnamed protein product [Closterium sp. NIES-65]|nr:unnamed protein product [Closterium sp. NIES-65]
MFLPLLLLTRLPPPPHLLHISEKAVAWALKNHIRPSDRVTLLHVRPVVESGPGLFAAYADSTLSAEAMAEVDRVREKHNAGVAWEDWRHILNPSYAGSTLSAEAMAEVDRVIEKHNAGVALCGFNIVSRGDGGGGLSNREAQRWGGVGRVTLLSVFFWLYLASYADSTLSAEAMAEVDRVIEKHNAGVRRKFVSNLSHQLDQAKVQYDLVAVQYDIVAVQDADLRERICESPCNEHVLSAAFSPPFLCLSYHLPLVLWPPPPGAIRHSGSAGRGSQGAHLPRGGEDEGTYTHHGVSGTQYREAVRCGAEMVQYGEAVRERSVVR